MLSCWLRLLRALLLCLATTSVHAALVSADRPRPPKPRRTKKNKYAQFSKADEVKKSLRFSNVDTRAEEASSVAPATAATAVEQTRERNKWLYPDEASIDQRDPTTFGFVEIGRVLGAHGVHSVAGGGAGPGAANGRQRSRRGCAANGGRR